MSPSALPGPPLAAGGYFRARHEDTMKTHPLPLQTTGQATLQTVLDRLAGLDGLSPNRKRDLRSAVISFAKLCEVAAAEIQLDLSELRRTLDKTDPARAKMSRKRWANLRSDLATAIAVSGLRPMLKTADLPVDRAWRELLAVGDRRIRDGLSRFSRWASLRRIAPRVVNNSTIERFIAELEAATLVRNLRDMPRVVAKAWNALVALGDFEGLRPVSVPGPKRRLIRIPWRQLPASFQADVERYLRWLSVPDPLEDGARDRRLAPRTLQLQQAHIHSAVTAAAAAGVRIAELASLACLVKPETFRALLRHRWQADGCRLSAYTHGLAITLIAIASEWVKAPPDAVATLKALRRKLGTLPSGLTEKNKALLRRFDNPHLISALIQLPDRLWRQARRGSTKSQRSFMDLQNALAIDLLIHVPLRMQNLAALDFETHMHWPRGRRNPALITFGGHQTKNKVELEFEIPTTLAERFWVYRNELAPSVIGRRPTAVFVTKSGKAKGPGALKLAIEKAVLRHLGVKVTPHQYRHLAAKFVLDNNAGAYELVRQLLGHTSLRTTTSFYAGIDTRRAGRAHAELVMKLREGESNRRPRAARSREE
jgi:integrase